MALSDLPARGAAVRGLGLPLPPQRMPRRQGARPLKRWRYVGVYGPELMLCVGEARIGPVPQRWWAVALPDGTLRQQTTIGRGGVELSTGLAVGRRARTCAFDLDLEEDEGVETVSPGGEPQLDLDPQAGGLPGARVRRARRPPLRDRRRGVRRRERRLPRAPHLVELVGGRTAARRTGERVAWNLVDGVHDAEHDSERTRLGRRRAPRGRRPVRVRRGPVRTVGELRVQRVVGARGPHEPAPVPLATTASRSAPSAGRLPGGLELAEGYGVME